MKWGEGPKDGMQTAWGEKQKSLVVFLLSVLIKRPGGRTETGALTDCLRYIVQPPHVSADTEQVLRGWDLSQGIRRLSDGRAEGWEFDGWGASRTVRALYGPWWSLSGQYFLYVVTALLILLHRFNHAPLLASAATVPHNVLCAWLWKTERLTSPLLRLSLTLLPIAQCSSERL